MLGARPHSVALVVTREALALTLAGTLVGAAASLGLSQMLRPVVPGAVSVDARILVAAMAVLVFSCSVACYLPVRRVGRLDPMPLLRAEGFRTAV